MVIVFGPCSLVLVISIFESIMLCYLMCIDMSFSCLSIQLVE